MIFLLYYYIINGIKSFYLKFVFMLYIVFIIKTNNVQVYSTNYDVILWYIFELYAILLFAIYKSNVNAYINCD